MSFEVTCGQCSGRLRVDQGGMVVACPHCGVHLDIADPNATETPASQPVTESAPASDIPAAAPEAAAQPTAKTEMPFPAFEPAAFEAGGIPGFDPTAPLLKAAGPPPTEPAAQLPAANGPAFDPTAATSIEVPMTAPGPAAAGVESTIFQGDSPTQSEGVPLQTEPAREAVPAPAELAPAPAQFTGPAAMDSLSTFTSSKKTASGTIPRKTFLIVASYASAMTLAAIWLLMKVLNPAANGLESLPDMEPVKDRTGEIGYRLVPEDAPMPIGHSLTLGEERRFGNLLVTPLRVSRGPLEFKHYDPASTATREPVAGVLKLWLKFENVSEDQSIAPLRSLLFERDSSDIDNERANTFVCRSSEKKKDGSRLLVYDHNLSGDWNIVGLNIDEELPPGASTELFVPTTDSGVDGLFGGDESLVWRVHFRKGYSRKRFGVTTVVEINFKEDDVAFDTKPNKENAPDAETEKA